MNLFCNAEKRPKDCKKAANVCCSVCDLNEECILLKQYDKIKPCTKDDNTDEEACPFAI